MRQYEPIWLAIKQNGEASIVAPIAAHRRIIQAVRKEKATDLTYRFELSEKRQRYELKEEVSNKLIRFYLVQLEYRPIPGLADL